MSPSYDSPTRRCPECGRDTILEAGSWGASNLRCCFRCGAPLEPQAEAPTQPEMRGARRGL